MDDFHRTRMGQEFFNNTMPGLVKQLKRLNDNLEKLLKCEEGESEEPREAEQQEG